MLVTFGKYQNHEVYSLLIEKGVNQLVRGQDGDFASVVGEEEDACSVSDRSEDSRGWTAVTLAYTGPLTLTRRTNRDGSMNLGILWDCGRGKEINSTKHKFLCTNGFEMAQKSSGTVKSASIRC